MHVCIELMVYEELIFLLFYSVNIWNMWAALNKVYFNSLYFI